VRRAKGDLASTMALTKDKARRWQCTWVQSAVRRRSQQAPGGVVDIGLEGTVSHPVLRPKPDAHRMYA
jgi:hypothetical protein